MTDLPEKVQEIHVENRYDRRGPGRPPKIPLRPDNEMVEEIMKRREREIDEDELRQQIDDNADDPEVLDSVMEELAREQAGLKFDRHESIRKGEGNDPTYSSKRVTALKSISQTFFKKRDMLLDEVFDFDSERFQKLFDLWGETFREAAVEVLSEEKVQKLFDVASEKFEGWEDEAREYIKTDL